MLNVLLIAALLSYQQVPTLGSITGTIVEARTNAPLAAVLVKVQSTGQQAFSDSEGRFQINDVPVGAQTLLVSVVGFGLVRREVKVDAAIAVDVTIPVAEGASTYVEDVAVSGSPFRETEPGVASQSTLGSRELLALRGLVADDPFRAVQVLPGVATGDDFRAEFAVRGLGPSNIGISIDGVDSPLLFHTVRGVQDTGTLGLINSDILESATLLAGPHPQRLNAHLGSRLDFTTRDGSRERLTVRGLLSASAASSVWEGPLGSSKKASWLVAVRKSYIDWLLRQIDETTDTTFGFLDGEAKLTLDLSPRQSLRVSMIAGGSVLRETEEPGPNTLDHAANTTVIGNLQWRFTPSATFSTAQQVYVLNAEYGNRVVDGRTREEGSDSRSYLARQRIVEPEGRSHDRIRGAGAVARRAADRSAVHAHHRAVAARCACECVVGGRLGAVSMDAERARLDHAWCPVRALAAVRSIQGIAVVAVRARGAAGNARAI